MPTQASILSKGYSRPSNLWFMFQAIVIFTASSVDHELMFTDENCIKMIYFCKKHESIHG